MIEDVVSCKFVEDNLAVMSVGFLLGSPDDAVIWRGPKKNGRWKLCYYFNMERVYNHIFEVNPLRVMLKSLMYIAGVLFRSNKTVFARRRLG